MRKKTGFYLPVIGVIKNKKKQILLVQRFDPKNQHSHLKWSFPGGEIEFGEHPYQTLIREVKEEVGIEINPIKKSIFIQNHVFEKEKIHIICLCYPAVYKSGKIDISKDDETIDAKWFNINDIDYNLCLPQTKEILKKALKLL